MDDAAVLEELFDTVDEDTLLPNIPMPTLGGEVFWDTIYEHGGWRLQQNVFTKHARILDSSDVRIAWGSLRTMDRLMDRIVEIMMQDGPQAGGPTEGPCERAQDEEQCDEDEEEDIEIV